MASTESKNAVPQGGLKGWINARFPLDKMLREHVTEYYAPKNFNTWYIFGVLALIVLVIQLVTGIFLTMNYKPSAVEAFGTVEYIMRDVEWGWLIRYLHSTGASAFFVVVYLHMFRALMYGSYKAPRELLWLIGMAIYLVLMAEAFMGYLLPWGNMSFWGAQVIVSLFGTIPVVGDGLVEWIRGDYYISDITLNRFREQLIGEDPLNVVKLYTKLLFLNGGYGATGGLTMHAASGIEIALWDLAGRLLQTPVCNLLGGRFRDKVRFYRTLQRPEKRPEEAQAWGDQVAEAKANNPYGFTMFKVQGDGIPPSSDPARTSTPIPVSSPTTSRWHPSAVPTSSSRRPPKRFTPTVTRPRSPFAGSLRPSAAHPSTAAMSTLMASQLWSRSSSTWSRPTARTSGRRTLSKLQ